MSKKIARFYNSSGVDFCQAFRGQIGGKSTEMKTGAVFGYFQFSSTMPNYGRVWAERQSTNFDRSRGKVEMEKYMHLWAKESRLVQIREGFQNES